MDGCLEDECLPSAGELYTVLLHDQGSVQPVQLYMVAIYRRQLDNLVSVTSHNSSNGARDQAKHIVG
jgi:hypothetical protein